MRLPTSGAPSAWLVTAAVVSFAPCREKVSAFIGDCGEAATRWTGAMGGTVEDGLAVADAEAEGCEPDASALVVQPDRASASTATPAATYSEADGRVGRGSDDTMLSHSASGLLR